MLLFEKLKRGFVAFRVRLAEGATNDISPLDHPSFQRVLTLILLLELSFAAWIFLVSQNSTTAEMTMTPGLRATRFLTDWIVMMVAMMFPTAAVMILAFNKAQGVHRHPDEAFGSTWMFVTAYLLVWAVAGIAAYSGVWFAERIAAEGALSPAIAVQLGGAILLVAGLYQFSPPKEICLSECRTPIDKTTWHHDKLGSFRMGMRHAFYCLGCNWLLFAALFPLGMTIGAMAIITLIILAEKTLPWPRFASYAAGVLLVLYGALLIASPQFPVD